MGRYCFLLLVSLLFLAVQQGTRAQDVQVPAGTLLRCTLNEPDFSSKSAEIGDPVLCYVSPVQEFGRVAFPRGAYLAGHLEAEKEPGHFVGKGSLRLVFDRIGLPNADVPISAKVIAARGFQVDRQGDILGKGHPRRDAIEWMFPPLWPWKVLSLPARGPRPALRGEQVLTLRLMTDVTVPQLTASALPDWKPAGSRGGASRFSEPDATPPYDSHSTFRSLRYALPSYPAMRSASSSLTYDLRRAEPRQEAEAAGVPRTNAPQLTLLALKNGIIHAMTQYWLDAGYLSYLRPSGASGDVSLDEVDWVRTMQLNAERGVSLTLHPRLRSD